MRVTSMTLVLAIYMTNVFAASYFSQPTGTCAEFGGSIIQTNVECQHAIEELGIAPAGTFDSCTEASCNKFFKDSNGQTWEYDVYYVSSRPSGCGAWQSHRHVRWSGLHSNEQCGGGSFDCVCKTATTARPTSTSPTTARPTVDPTPDPTAQPSSNPTELPTKYPSSGPSLFPSAMPTHFPSTHPTTNPSRQPSFLPTMNPTTEPTADPSRVPSVGPSAIPSVQPSTVPTAVPVSDGPTSAPSSVPSTSPSRAPSRSPTMSPSAAPSVSATTERTIADNDGALAADDATVPLVTVILIVVVVGVVCSIVIAGTCAHYRRKAKRLENDVANLTAMEPQKTQNESEAGNAAPDMETGN